MDELLNRALLFVSGVLSNVWDTVGPAVGSIALIAFVFYLFSVWTGGK